jgi:hypothetical protein
MATSQYTDEQIVAGFIQAAGATRSMVARIESSGDALDRLLGELRSVRSYAAGISSDEYAYSKICEQHNRLLEARQILQNLKEILQ